MMAPTRRSRARRNAAFLRALAFVLCLPTLALVLLSPLLLGWFADRFSRSDWGRLSEIGQAYGGIAAILTALTLIGLIVTLVLQINQSRMAREEFMRTRQQELVRMLLDDPILAEGVGLPVGTPEEVKFSRQRVYVNLWINHWFSLYRLGYIEEIELRDLARREAFSSPAGRFLWNRAADTYRRGDRASKRSREFARILDEEWEAANNKVDVSSVGPSGNASPTRARSLPVDSIKSGALFAVIALLIGWLARLILNRKQSRSCHSTR
ncbi:hypothetical protein SAMN05421833_13650 [Microbispora rosea]|uniref:Uncharacterized protein n=1 Tax=Microbispora rosea TaxID=58117 RepID=A0A1N7H3Z3_9ACTN|nr:DUF6082 family protein [Microbispora rosea]SIS19470.1 hypothetical protein SAMN05421833_13650 [Microbispora rosea]